MAHVYDFSAGPGDWTHVDSSGSVLTAPVSWVDPPPSSHPHEAKQSVKNEGLATDLWSNTGIF